MVRDGLLRSLAVVLVGLVSWVGGRSVAAAPFYLEQQTSFPVESLDFGEVVDLAVDTNGTVYVAGHSRIGPTPLARVLHGWLAKVGPDGGLAWLTYFGGADRPEPGVMITGLELSTSGRLYVSGVGYLDSAEVSEAFVLAFDADGRRLRRYSLPGAAGIALDNEESLFVTGDGVQKLRLPEGTPEYSVPLSSFPAFPAQIACQHGSAHVVTPVPSTGTTYDIGVSVLGTDGELLREIYIGGSNDDRLASLVTAGDGRVVLVGDSTSADYPLQNALQLFGGLRDATVTVLDAGGVIVGSTYLGGRDHDDATSVAICANGDIAVAGVTLSVDFPSMHPIDGEDGAPFLVVLSGEGQQLLQATRIGPLADPSLAALADGRLVLAGYDTNGGIDPRVHLRWLADGKAAFTPTFAPKPGNTWWVETSVRAAEALSGVDARVGAGSWVALGATGWGTWAKSFFVPNGSRVEFRARASSGASTVSAAYRWPEAVPYENDAPTFTATFSAVRGNDWWVETNVAASSPLAGVDARAGGAWVMLEPMSWGSWATSMRVASGSRVEFRARSADGQAITSASYAWPP